MSCGIFRFFNFIFNFFQHFKKSQKTFKQPDIEKNEINEEKRDEQSAETDAPCQISYRRAVFMVAFYFYLNFVNFVDDFILMAILPIIIEDFHSTIIRFQLIFLGFLCSRMIISPFLTGAIPRYKQKMVLCIGLLFYSVLAFGCTYIPQQGFWLFLLVRLFVSSMAESCLGMVPVMIGDIFRPDQRTRMLGFYTCTNAFCCMLACIFGASAIDLASSNWRYALRITPAFGLFGLLLAIIIVKDPREGMEDEDDESDIPESKSNCCSDLKQLLTSCSFLSSTAGMLCYALVYGSKTVWVFTLIQEDRKELHIKAHCLTKNCNYDDNLFYGIIRCALDLIGYIIGMELSKYSKKRTPDIDAVLAGIGLITCAPFFLFFIFMPEINIPVAYVSIISP
ncbi:hypothetical protein XENTR_v10009801 [Xenopus tropicalis]|nr:hypothetical protein XENTR_v10009801 [Xenopus tropicalis]